MTFEPITTDYVVLTEEEQVRYSLHIHRKRIRAMMILSFVGIPMMVAGAYYANELTFFVGLMILFLGIVDRVYIKDYTKRQYRNPKNVLFRTPSRSVIDDHTIAFESKAGSSSVVPWSTVIKIEKLEDDYLLYVTQYTPLVFVPRGQTAESWKRFSELVELKKAILEEAVPV